MKSCRPVTGPLELNSLENFYRKTKGHPLIGKMLRYSLSMMVIYADSLNENKILKKESAKFIIKDIVNETVMTFYINEAPMTQVIGKMECESSYYLLNEYVKANFVN